MISVGLKFCVFVVVLLALTQCATKTAAPPAPDLSDSVLGLKIGMSKEDADKRLRESGEFKEAMEKRQEVWFVKNDKHFNGVAVGYDRENRVRYVTAYSEPGKVSERLRFTAVGDLTKAAQEITDPHHRYTWKVPAANGKPEYVITIYGADKEFLSMYTMGEIPNSGKSEDE